MARIMLLSALLGSSPPPPRLYQSIHWAQHLSHRYPIQANRNAELGVARLLVAGGACEFSVLL